MDGITYMKIKIQKNMLKQMKMQIQVIKICGLQEKQCLEGNL